MTDTRARRVALVFGSFGVGGIERGMLALAEGFLERGVKVDLVVVNGTGPLRAFVPGAARVVDLRAMRASRAVPALTAYFRRSPPVAVLAAQTHVNLLAIAARTLARCATRLVVSEHIAMDVAAANATRLRERLYPIAARCFYRYADRIVLVTDAAADRFARATGIARHEVCVIHNPIVTPQLLSDAHRPAPHHWFDAAALPIILSVGRLTAQKDHRTLIEAFAQLRRRCPARLMILGDGPERARLSGLVHSLGLDDDVALVGFVAHPAAFMARARLFVLSSRWEGSGNVLIEAMACGVPVVSTDCPSGPAELLEAGRYGRLTPVGDPDALAAAMALALSDPVPVDRLRGRAHEFSLDRAVTAYAAEMHV